MNINELNSNEESIKSNVYLDYNIFINYRNKPDVREVLENLKIQYVYYYGPPYLEEVANIPSKYIEQIQSHKYDIDKLFELRTFRPTDTNKLVKVLESVEIVSKRVLELLALSEIAETYEETMFIMFKKLRAELNFNSKIISNILPNEIFTNLDVLLFVEKLAMDNPAFLEALRRTKNYTDKNNFTELQYCISALFNVLEIVGFRPEGKKKIRS